MLMTSRGLQSRLLRAVPLLTATIFCMQPSPTFQARQAGGLVRHLRLGVRSALHRCLRLSPRRDDLLLRRRQLLLQPVRLSARLRRRGRLLLSRRGQLVHLMGGTVLSKIDSILSISSMLSVGIGVMGAGADPSNACGNRLLA